MFFRYVRDLLLMRAANNAVAMSLPALASVLSFVTYSLSGHQLNPANIFASLTLFNLLRLPLMMLREYNVACLLLTAYVLSSNVF